MNKDSSRRKRSRSSTGAGKTKNIPVNPGRKYELIGLMLCAVGLISICGIFGFNVGFIGIYFAKFLHYLFGVGAIFITILILMIGWQYMAKHRGISYTVPFFGGCALFVILLAIWHHVVIPPGEEIMPDSLPRGGGLIGGGLLFLVRKFFGVDGSIILLVFAGIGSVLLATKWSLSTGLLKTEEKARQGAKATGAAIAITYKKVAQASDHVEQQLVTTVKETVAKSFYNQDKDTHFSEITPSDNEQTHMDEGETLSAISQEEQTMMEQVSSASEAEESASIEEPASAVPRFTIEYGRQEVDEPMPAPQAEYVPPNVPPSPSPMRKNAISVSDYEEIAPIMPAAALLDGSVPVPRPDAEIAPHGKAQERKAVEKPYELPCVERILTKREKKKNAMLSLEIEEKASILQRTLSDFKVQAKIINACHGPAVTRYELEPAPGVKVSKITNLAEDLALSLAASAIRIEPIPGKAAIGIEVPNKELEGVQLREVLESSKFSDAKSRLTVGLGIDIGGNPIFADLAKMPHLLVAGATGSGKSVCINTLITSILFKATPEEVKFILVDPKMVELSNYNGIPHLMVPVVTEAKKAASVLNWSVQEMEKRYAKFADCGVRNMETYNAKFSDEKMPAIVIIIDELADLMMVAPHDVEDAICRLAQKARAAGIHMVLATQRPSVDVITGIIKANIPSRISFAVSSQIDSRTILDRSGAEKLLGKGDMLFYPVGASKPTRVQGAFISDGEVESLLAFIRSQGQEMEANEEIISFTENAAREEAEEDGGKSKSKKSTKDELLADAVELVMTTGQASTSSIQRRFRIGYTRAGRLIDEMEALHIVGPNAGSKPREILMTNEQAMEALAREKG